MSLGGLQCLLATLNHPGKNDRIAIMWWAHCRIIAQKCSKVTSCDIEQHRTISRYIKPIRDYQILSISFDFFALHHTSPSSPTSRAWHCPSSLPYRMPHGNCFLRHRSPLYQPGLVHVLVIVESSGSHHGGSSYYGYGSKRSKLTRKMDGTSSMYKYHQISTLFFQTQALNFVHLHNSKTF